MSRFGYMTVEEMISAIKEGRRQKAASNREERAREKAHELLENYFSWYSSQGHKKLESAITKALLEWEAAAREEAASLAYQKAAIEREAEHARLGPRAVVYSPAANCAEQIAIAIGALGKEGQNDG